MDCRPKSIASVNPKTYVQKHYNYGFICWCLFIFLILYSFIPFVRCIFHFVCLLLLFFVFIFVYRTFCTYGFLYVFIYVYLFYCFLFCQVFVIFYHCFFSACFSYFRRHSLDSRPALEFTEFPQKYKQKLRNKEINNMFLFNNK